MKVTVKVFEQDREILNKVLSEGAFRAGRSEFCDLVLPGNDISRSHLEIRVTESSVYLTNMSTPGRIKVNGERVETAEVKDGDNVEVGPYRMTVLYGEQEAAAAPPPMPSEGLPGEDQGMEIPGMPSADGANNLGGEAINLFDSPNANPLEQENERAPAPAAVALAEPQPEPQFAEVREFPMGMASADNLSVQGSMALQRSDTVVEPKPLVAKLLFLEGPKKGDEVPLESYEVTMGRSRKADIFIDDEKLSRKHAKIARIGLGYRLIDLESRNGTYVNGVRVLEHPLNSFDIIELGHTKIKFLVLDLAMGNMPQGGALQTVKPQEDTKTYQASEEEQAIILQFPKETGLPLGPPPGFGNVPAPQKAPDNGNLNRVLLGILIIAVVGYFLIPDNQKKADTKTPAAQTTQINPEVKLPPQVPKEYADLTPDEQRKVEGYYNNAIRYQENEVYDKAYGEIRKIHDLIPFYKESKKLEEFYYRKLKEKQTLEATQKASQDRQAELQIYLEDGLEYLKEGDFDRAAEAFNNAIVLDPRNVTAAKGLKAAQLHVRDIDNLPVEKDPELEKKKLVNDLLDQAITKFRSKSYQETIDLAEKVRKIEIRGETEYLNNAKQLIDRARMQQKEEFEPFLIQAKEKFAEGDYNASRDLCEEMLKRDPAYDDAKECTLKAKKQLNRLAKEAYTHGYILESMNRLEEAKQYWNRAKNYVRQGDDYYDKVMKKLDQYQ